MSLIVRFEHPDDICLRLPAMNDQRLSDLSCQLQMTLKKLFLQRERRAVPVTIQACFTDSHHHWICHQFDNLRPIVEGFCHMIRLDPHGGTQHGEASGQFKIPATGCPINTDRDYLLYARCSRSSQDLGQIFLKTIIIEMGVSIE